MKILAILTSSLIIILAILLIWESSFKIAYMEYTKPAIIFSSVDGGDSKRFNLFSIPASINGNLNDKITFYWHGKPQRLSGMTSATLGSLNFTSLFPTPDFRKIEGDHSAVVSFAWDDRRKLEYLVVHCTVKDPHTCPYALSFDGNSILRFPASRSDIGVAFGSTYRTTYRKTHPFFSMISRIIMRLLPIS